MNEYNICTDYIAIIAGTDKPYSKAYIEAAEAADKNTPKGSAKMKKMISSIESVSAKSKDARISKSRGNIKQFAGYESIKTALAFSKKHLAGTPLLNDVTTIFNALESNAELYTDGYSKNNRLIILEYESAVYMCVTGLSMLIANNLDVEQKETSVVIKKKNGQNLGVINSTAKGFAKQIGAKNHKSYLEGLLAASEMKGSTVSTEIKESTTFMEASIADTAILIDTITTNIANLGRFAKRTFVGIKNSLFGIIPMIRSVMYLRYKKKADTILALEQQVQFIERNIEQLENMKNMDPAKKAEVIKRQKAYIEAYRKKAEKLRAQLTETEREAATEIKKDDPKISNDDDDFVLEWGGSNEDLDAIDDSDGGD